MLLGFIFEDFEQNERELGATRNVARDPNAPEKTAAKRGPPEEGIPSCAKKGGVGTRPRWRPCFPRPVGQEREGTWPGRWQGAIGQESSVERRQRKGGVQRQAREPGMRREEGGGKGSSKSPAASQRRDPVAAAFEQGGRPTTPAQAFGMARVVRMAERVGSMRPWLAQRPKALAFHSSGALLLQGGAVTRTPSKPPGAVGEEKRRKHKEQHHPPTSTVGAPEDITSAEALARVKPLVVSRLDLGGCGAGSGPASSRPDRSERCHSPGCASAGCRSPNRRGGHRWRHWLGGREGRSRVHGEMPTVRGDPPHAADVPRTEETVCAPK